LSGSEREWEISGMEGRGFPQKSEECLTRTLKELHISGFSQKKLLTLLVVGNVSVLEKL
jgi:hypothetical protein